MNVAVVGSRDFDNYEIIRPILQNIINSNDTIVSGGAKGVDAMAKRFAKENNLVYLEFSADWKQYGKSAGIIRNLQIVKASEVIIAFQHNNSKGTQNTINTANNLEKKCLVFTV